MSFAQALQPGKVCAALTHCPAVQHEHLDLIAAGAGAGVAAGFGAPMSGVLFAVETMLLAPSRTRMLTPQPHVTAAGAEDDDDGGVQVRRSRTLQRPAMCVARLVTLRPALHDGCH